MADLRGNQLAMIFQEPMSALIRYSPSASSCASRLFATAASRRRSWQHAIQLLADVGLARADSLMANIHTSFPAACCSG